MRLVVWVRCARTQGPVSGELPWSLVFAFLHAHLLLDEHASELVRRSAVALDVGIGKEVARLLQALRVRQRLRGGGRRAIVGIFELDAVELLAAVVKNLARGVGAEERGDRLVKIDEGLVR